mgnify:CR=1 FL=1
MALDNIAVTVREGDSFDELYLNIEKPWGTPYNYSNSVLVADISRFFNDNTIQQPALRAPFVHRGRRRRAGRRREGVALL